MKHFLFALVLSFPLFASASTALEARVLSTTGCTYFSRIELQVRATLQDESLPWGTKVELVSAGKILNLHNTSYTTDWQMTEAAEATAVAPFTWQAVRSLTYAERSSPLQTVGVQFVWKITRPDGQVIFEKGNTSSMGFYEADVDHMTVSCQPADQTPWSVRKLTSVDR